MGLHSYAFEYKLILIIVVNCSEYIRVQNVNSIFKYFIHLFIYGLFNDAVSSSDDMALNDRLVSE
jgi:hypothetical protein